MSTSGTSPALIRSERHIASVRQELRAAAHSVVDAMAHRGHQIVAVQGVRTDAEQFAIWRVGRELRDGRWVVVGQTNTKAMTSYHTPHGETWRAALDFAFLIGGQLVGPKPGPGNDSWDPELPWKTLVEMAESFGLESGGRFPPIDAKTGLGWDPGHVQLPKWRSLLPPPRVLR